ncbi:MAG: DUF3267 domain-containing protein [bacterium]
MMRVESGSQQPLEGMTRQAYTVSVLQANVYSFVTGLGPALLGLAGYVAVWDVQGLGRGMISLSLWGMLLVAVVGIVVHELLHGVGWLAAGRLPREAVKLGFQWKVLTPYAHARVPMPARAYRWGVALPGLALGILPMLLGIVVGNGTLLAFGFFFTFTAGGDFLVLWLLRRVPGTALVEDHPSEVGGYVYRRDTVAGGA